MTAFEVALCRSFGFLAEENQKLLGNDREDLNVDTIELVEAAPGTCRGEAFEELTDHDVVHGIGAVEDDTLFGKGLGKILGGFGFSSTSGSCGSTSEVELEGTH